MRFRQKITVETEEIIAIECDRCKARVDADNIEGGRDEYITVGGSGGYASRFWGDMTRWWVDLCEKCQHELFANFANIEK